MYGSFRQAELVGKRFLCVREKNSLRPNSRSSRVSNPLDYQWKVGVIRACSEKDFHHPELKVLVEYDNEDWTTRDWLKIHDGSWKIFLVEKMMVWSQRPDPSNPRRPLLWPALTFSPLVDKHGLSDEDRPIPVEFVGDHERVFVRNDEFRPYGQDDDALQPAVRNSPVVMEELRAWQRLQKSQSILLDGPFTLTGFRVQVYRQTCRQWFSAVITAHDLISRELSVMDDTVLQTHRVNPRLIQVILLANEAELDSLLRGELVRVLPMRQHRHSQVIITAPLTTQTTTSSLPSNAPTTWQLYAGLTQVTNSNNLANSTEAAYTPPVTSTTTRRSTACSPPSSQSKSTAKERRKSTETRNRSSASRRITRSDSANSPAPSNDTHQPAPQKVQSSFTSSSATPLTSSSHRAVTHTSSQLSNKSSPPEACTLSPKNSSSSSMGSPSSSLPKKSPVKQPMSPKTSPTMLQYGSPVSKAGISSMGSPFRSNPFCSSPDMSSVASMASPISAMSHMGIHSPGHVGHSRAQSPHPLYSHGIGHLNLSPNQLYALRLQQQQQQQMQSHEQQEFLNKLRHQHFESLLHQYQMHCYQLQLMVQQQELIQQMPLTPEQQHILAECYNQLLYQYQCAHIFQQLAAVTQEEQLSMFHPIDERGTVISTLPERIQQQLREAQERQREELQNLMPRLEPEQLQTFFTCLQQQSMTSEQIKQLYTLLIQQQQAQRRVPCAQQEQQEDEQQEHKLQQYLRQNQEQLQKFLKLPKSPPFPQEAQCKQEPKQEATCYSSSPQPDSPSSSPFPSSSSASSFTVHHLPTLSDAAASSNVNSENKLESEACVASSTSGTLRHQGSPSTDEIELTSTTTEGQRSNSPHAILEKLLQHHLQAVKENKQETSTKTRRTRASSTEKKSKRQRKSAESSSTRTQNKDNNDLEKDSQKVTTTALVPDSSTEDPVSCSLTVDASKVQDCVNISVNQNFSENEKKSSVNKYKLPRNVGLVDSHLAEEKYQSKTEENNTASEVAHPLVIENSTQKSGLVNLWSRKETPQISGLTHPLAKEDSRLVSGLARPSAAENSHQVSELVRLLAKKDSPPESGLAHPVAREDSSQVSELTRPLAKEGNSQVPRLTRPAAREDSSQVSEVLHPAVREDISQVSGQVHLFAKEDGHQVSRLLHPSARGDSRQVSEVLRPAAREDSSQVSGLAHRSLKEDSPQESGQAHPFTKEDSHQVSRLLHPSVREDSHQVTGLAHPSTAEDNSRVSGLAHPSVREDSPQISGIVPSLAREVSHQESRLACPSKRENSRQVSGLAHHSVREDSSQASGLVHPTATEDSSQVSGMACPSTREDSLQKTRPKVLTGGVIKKAPPESASLGSSEIAQNDKPSNCGIVSESLDVLKDKATILTQKCSEKRPVKSETKTKTTISRGLSKKSSSKTSQKEGTSSSDNLSVKDIIAGLKTSKLSANILEKKQLTMDVDPSLALQKPFLNSGPKDFTTNRFSVFSSNSTELDGELFSGKELKTYSKKVTPNKRKSSSNGSILEDSSAISKVLKMDNKEASEIVTENSKVEVDKKLNRKLLNTQPKQKLTSRQLQNSVPSAAKGKMSRKTSTDESSRRVKKAKCEESTDSTQRKSVGNVELRDEVNSVVDSVSFVADQAVIDIAINHSPTMKDMPANQFEPNNERLNNKSKERIREMTFKKKELLKAKEQKRKEKKNVSAVLPMVVKSELDDGENFETMVDSVLDEEIAVIYNGGEYQESHDFNSSEIKQEGDTKNKGVVKAVEKPVKQKKKRETTTKDAGRSKRKRRPKKRSESDGDAVSPNTDKYFLQDRVCAKFSHLPKCRDCRDIYGEKTGLEFCRFNMFRRLKKRKNGRVLAAGFQLPEHAAAEDFSPWVAQDKVERMDKKTSLYILFNVGDQFCNVMQEEKKAITQAGENVPVAYKRAVQGVREMCDVCATTIFNMHWVCHRCGFGVCLDCYNLRVKEREEQPGIAGKRVFEFKWFMCCPGICHQPKYLSVAQIIPKTVLSDLGDELHRVREVWDIGKTCPCKGGVGNQNNKSAAKITELSDKVEEKTDEKEQRNDRNVNCVSKGEASEATVKTGAASSSTGSGVLNQNLGAMDSESSFEGSDDVNLICDESLGVESPADRDEWLTEEKRRNHVTKKAGFGLVEAKPRHNKGISSGLSLLMDYNSSAEGSPCESPANSDARLKAGAFNFTFSSGLALLALACEKDEGMLLSSNVSLDHGSNTQAEKSKQEPHDDKQKDEEIRNVSLPVSTLSESTCAESSDEVRQATLPVPDSSDMDACTDAPHSWLCDGRLLRLHEPRAPGNLKAFELRWKKGEPVLVSHVDKYLNLDIWTPKSFGQEFGSEIADVVNCRNGVVVEKFKVGDFWEGFESIKDRPLDNNGEPMLLKLKDWPPKDDFSEKLPTRFEDLMNNVPLPEYTRRDGSRNLVSRLPEFFVKPDLGPKMYNAYGSAACPKEGTTNLHLDMSDAVNVMVYVGVPRDHGAGERERDDAIKAVDEACDESQRIRVRKETARIGALWHIYAAEDADKIRHCLREIAKERKMKYSQHHDPIHDQCFYLDHDIRERLKKEYGVQGWAICQCLGDAVFIPAGAPHQVRNLYSCVKVAEDFVSPERIDHCFRMTQEFRHLSDKHTNHEDKLQVKNIIYHAVKDALSSLKHYEQERESTEQQMETDREV